MNVVREDMKLVGCRGRGRWRRMIRCGEPWGEAKRRRPVLVYKDHFKTNSTFLIVSVYNSAKSWMALSKTLSVASPKQNFCLSDIIYTFVVKAIQNQAACPLPLSKKWRLTGLSGISTVRQMLFSSPICGSGLISKCLISWKKEKIFHKTPL